MKRLTALLLVFVLLLWGCKLDGDPNSSKIPGTEQGELIRPDVKIIDFSAPALVVRITINPDLELTLNHSNVILSVKPLNEDAQALLAELDVVGQPYNSGIVTILGEAKEQEFLTNSAKVSISVREEDSDGWNTASQILLSTPIENFRAGTGMAFSCNITAAGQIIDPEKLYLKDTTQTEEYFMEAYYDDAGRHRMSTYTYMDGTYTEEFFSDDYELISVTYRADGIYAYLEVKDLIQTSYIVYPDGTTYQSVMKMDDDHNILWQLFTDTDGRNYEEFYFYEAGRLTRCVVVDPDGNEFETIYLEDGGIQNPDGGTEYQNPDGTTTIRYPDGSTTLITYYGSGMVHTQNRTYPNGDYENYTYREDGTLWKVVSLQDGVSVEGEHDAMGRLYKDTIRHADGTEGEVLYYTSGNISYVNMIYPNGDYETTHYFESGAVSAYISQIDGEYSETHYDENGNLVP